MAGLQPAGAMSGAALSSAEALRRWASIEWTLFCSVSTKQLAAGGNDGGEFTQANAIRVAGLDRIFFLLWPSPILRYTQLSGSTPAIALAVKRAAKHSHRSPRGCHEAE